MKRKKSQKKLKREALKSTGKIKYYKHLSPPLVTGSGKTVVHMLQFYRTYKLAIVKGV
eukprot:TRINITY_DN584_c0_g1_i2.p1 TRINITY_DN584_c0_g1~~TRINITY_DN584_c0_g1_i2.p1  ORF type:complete len:58 (-),score=4.05 TRINITY_DN584_c0_g1_i2:132-305(-)